MGCLLLLAASGAATAQERPGDSPQRWLIQANASYISVDTADASWLHGGLGKLRYDESNPSLVFDRLLLDYRAAVTPTVFAQLDIDYTHDGSRGFDLAEGINGLLAHPFAGCRHGF